MAVPKSASGQAVWGFRRRPATSDVDPAGVDGSGRWSLWDVGMLPGVGDLGRSAVTEAGVRPVVIALDVLPDLPSGLVDGLPLRAPGAALLELAEPGLDDRLGLRIAVAAAAVGDAAGGRVPAEIPGGELRAVIAAEGQPARLDPPPHDGGLDDSDRLVVPAAQIHRPADQLPVQQSMMASR